MFCQHCGTPALPVLPGVQAPLDSSQCCDVTLQTTAVTVSKAWKKNLTLADIGLKLGPHHPLLGYLRAKQISPKDPARIRGTMIGGGTSVM